MLRITGISLVVASLLLSYCYERFDFFHFKLISILYMVMFFGGIIVFCFSKPIRNTFRNSKIRAVEIWTEKILMLISCSIASILLIIGGYGLLTLNPDNPDNYAVAFRFKFGWAPMGTFSLYQLGGLVMLISGIFFFIKTIHYLFKKR